MKMIDNRSVIAILRGDLKLVEGENCKHKEFVMNTDANEHKQNSSPQIHV